MDKVVSCDVGLLLLLEKSSVQDISFLVDVLTDEGKGRIALSSSIKELLLREQADKRYTQAGLRHLLHELQEFGGHSLANIFRSEPLSYAELLTDVHKKLNGMDSKTKSIWQKEREIVWSLFGEGWNFLPDRARWDRCTEAKVVTGFFNMNDHLNYDEKGILIGGLSAVASAAAWRTLGATVAKGAAAATLGTAVVALQSMTEAYRITIPFVAHIALLKMKTLPALSQA